MSTETLEKTDTEIDPITGEPRATHIVPGDDKHTGVELVMRARINGTMVTALCGYTWTPQRNPENFPICSRCKEIYDKASEHFGLGNRDPSQIRKS